MESKKPLLCCVEDFNEVQIVESETRKGTYVAKGLFAKGDVETSNKRVYPSTVLKREIDRLQEDIKQKKVMGELDHPFDGKTKLSRTSHIITALNIDEKGNVYGEAEILDTQKGKDLKAILEAGGKVGVSSRGFGGVKKVEGKNLVQDDFNLQTFDFVSNPAQKEAYPAIFMEAEGAVADGVEVVLNKIEHEFPHLFDEMRERVRSSMKEEIESEVTKRLTEQKILVEDEIRKDFNSKMNADESKKSIVVLEDIARAIKPYIDSSKSDENVDKLNHRIEELETALNETTMYARVAGHNLFIERELCEFGKEDKDTILSIVGDVSRFDKLDSLKEAVHAAIDKVKSISEARNALETKKDEEIEKLNDKISILEGELTRIKRDLSTTKRVTEARERLGKNPLVEEAVVRVSRGEDVDDVIDEIEAKTETDNLIENVHRAKSRDRRVELDSLLESARGPARRGSSGSDRVPTPVLTEDLFKQSLELSRRMNR